MKEITSDKVSPVLFKIACETVPDDPMFNIQIFRMQSAIRFGHSHLTLENMKELYKKMSTSERSNVEAKRDTEVYYTWTRNDNETVTFCFYF